VFPSEGAAISRDLVARIGRDGRCLSIVEEASFRCQTRYGQFGLGDFTAEASKAQRQHLVGMPISAGAELNMDLRGQCSMVLISAKYRC